MLELVSVRRQFQETRGRDENIIFEVKGERLKLMSRKLIVVAFTYEQSGGTSECVLNNGDRVVLLHWLGFHQALKPENYTSGHCHSRRIVDSCV